jgi:hypothetical protein
VPAVARPTARLASRPAPGPGCAATIRSEPADAPVRIDGASAGRTPLEGVSVPCGDLLVTIDHPRYERVEKRLVAADGNEARLEVRLARPPGVLELQSSPPGAAFTVNGAQAGRAPTTAKVPAFTFVRVKASLEGFGTWSQKVYVLGTRMSITAPLEPGRRPIRPSPKPQL